MSLFARNAHVFLHARGQLTHVDTDSNKSSTSDALCFNQRNLRDNCLDSACFAIHLFGSIAWHITGFTRNFQGQIVQDQSIFVELATDKAPPFLHEVHGAQEFR